MSLLDPLAATWPFVFNRATFSPSGAALSMVCASQSWAVQVARFVRSFGIPVVVIARCGGPQFCSYWVVGAGFSLASVLAFCRRRAQCGRLFRVWSPSFSGIVGFGVGAWRGFGFWSPGVPYSPAHSGSIRRGWRPFRRGPSALLWAGWLASGCSSRPPSLRRSRAPLPVASPVSTSPGLGSRVGGSPSPLARYLAALPALLRPSAVLWRPSRRIRAAVAACFFSSFGAASALAQHFPGSALRRSGAGWSVSVPFRGSPGGVPLARHLSVALSIGGNQ